MSQYREVLYKDYFTTHIGRNIDINSIQKQFAIDAKQFEADMVPLLPKDKSINILEIGCGFGSLISCLKKAGYTNIVGIDISDEQVAIAHQLHINEVFKADLIPYLQNHKGKFDVIIGVDIIEHFTKDELVVILQLLRTSLNADGRAIFRTPNLDAPFASLFANGDFTHENFLNASSISQVLHSCGFGNVKVTGATIYVNGFLKELVRKLLWNIIQFSIKIILFASGRPSKSVLLSPNMLIKASL